MPARFALWHPIFNCAAAVIQTYSKMGYRAPISKSRVNDVCRFEIDSCAYRLGVGDCCSTRKDLIQVTKTELSATFDVANHHERFSVVLV